MFIKRTYISNTVGAYATLNKSLFYWEDNKLTNIDFESYKVNWTIKGLNSQKLFFIEKDCIYPYRQYKEFYKISIFDGSIIQSIQGDIFPVTLKADKIYIEYDKGTDIYCAEINLDNFFIKELFILKAGQRLLFSNADYAILKENKSFLSCKHFKSEQELWNVDVGEMGKWLDYDGKSFKSGEVKNLYSVGEKYIIAEIERSALACFELETGRVMWKFNGPYTTHFLVSLYKDKFFVFSDYYYEICAETGAVLRKEDYVTLLEQAKLKQYMLTAPAINDRYIAIASHYDSAVLLINRETFSVHQRIDLEGCQNGIPLGNTPRLHGNRLFQQDGDGTLYIFEEE